MEPSMKTTSIVGWGLLCFVLLAVFTIFLAGQWIEDDLAERNLKDLTAAGQGWASVTMNGRDATLSGEAPDDESAKIAVDVIANVWGVRLVKNEAKEPQ